MFGGGPDGLRRQFSQDQLKPRNLSYTLGRFLEYFGHEWPLLVLVAFLVVAATWTQVTNPELTGQVVDCYITPALGAGGGGSVSAGPAGAEPTLAENCWLPSDRANGDVTQDALRALIYLGATPPTTADMLAFTADERIAGLARVIGAVLALFVAGALLTGSSFFVMSWAGQRVLRDLRIDLFKHMHRLSLGYYTEHEAGDLMGRITNDSSAIEQAFGFAIINVFSGALLLIWTAYNMLVKSVPFALLSMSVLPLMAWATAYFSDQARKAYRASRAEMGSVNAELQEGLSAVRETQAFNRAEENIEQFRATNAANRDANVRAVSFTSALAPALEALGYVALAIVTGVGGYFLLNGQDLTLLGFTTSVSLGVVVTYLAYVQRFNQPIQQIAVLWTNIQNAVAGGERIFGLLDTPSAIADKPDAKPMPPITGRVELVDARAEYKQGVPVLKGVTLTAEPGQTIAIVGPTGAGKTTIINLLPRFWDVTGGAVKIDGIDVRDVTLETLRRQIGIVLQDSFLFSTTVMENIRFGRPTASDDEVMAAARLARADQFIERLPEGYNTVLGERGSGLSQGQRQLLSIARAALADPRILILDEATSSVDTRTERLIQRAFDELLKGRTAFVIAHRLSTIRNADEILVLKAGEIIERGKFDALLARKGFFYDLYMSQFRAQEAAGPAAAGLNGATASV
ncbi:MAG TPA: ABC transporter ATP-binding protein [Anaerolineales bacterium]|nr:ABC transporter ATP-binding protein [Anaerolineales bacterium]HRF46902.1 ABC transporter ATP-binding protein [Anaerolineales bacterium]